MRRILPILICLLLCGCSPKEQSHLEHAETAMETGLMSAVQYYMTADGLLVPVARELPVSVDYAAGSLNLLVSTPENDAVLNAKGLFAPLPAGVTFLYRESSGVAEIDLAGLPALPDRAAEERVVNAVLGTALALPNVTSVKLTFDGEPCQSLKNGTDVGRTISAVRPNPEPLPVSAVASPLNAITLYYPASGSDYLVPVTRYRSGECTAVRALEELLRGSGLAGVENPFPEDALLTSVLAEGDQITLDFTLPMMEISGSSARQTAVLQSLIHTLLPYASFDTLVLTLEGAPYLTVRGSSAPQQIF